MLPRVSVHIYNCDVEYSSVTFWYNVLVQMILDTAFLFLLIMTSVADRINTASLA
jgi:hypothetical protein